MLIIAVIVAVSIGITKSKLDNVLSYTYYNGYSTLRKITTEMLANWNPKDPEYREVINNEKTIKMAQLDFSNGLQNSILKLKDRLLSTYRDLWFQPAYARCERWYIEVGKSCQESGGQRCSANHDEGAGCYACCTCTKICSPGFVLNSATCTCQCNRTCSGGYKLNASSCICEKIECSNRPSSIPCGQSWNEDTCSLVGTPKTCPDGYTLDSSCTCQCSRTCPSGYKLNTSSCSCEKLPCTNKPSSIPCGQSWNEETCSLIGSAKSCPSGQHLNRDCQCVVDCPSDLTLCKRCDTETGVISQNPDINRTCTDETYEWSEEQCKCIPTPRTLPRKGENFCKLFEHHSNIMGNTDICLGSVVSDATTDFTGKKADITLGNGIRLYNMHSDATEIAVLAGNTQGGTYDGVPNTNSYGYTVYVDIDGVRGDSQLWSDVYPFYITLSGKIIPAYDKANPGVSGGDSTHHLQVSVQYEDYSSGNRRMKWLSKSTSFKEGACLSGYVGDATPYCKDSGAVSKLSECSIEGNSMCHLKQIQPVKFFF